MRWPFGARSVESDDRALENGGQPIVPTTVPKPTPELVLTPQLEPKTSEPKNVETSSMEEHGTADSVETAVKTSDQATGATELLEISEQPTGPLKENQNYLNAKDGQENNAFGPEARYENKPTPIETPADTAPADKPEEHGTVDSLEAAINESKGLTPEQAKAPMPLNILGVKDSNDTYERFGASVPYPKTAEDIEAEAKTVAAAEQAKIESRRQLLLEALQRGEKNIILVTDTGTKIDLSTIRTIETGNTGE